MEMKSVANCLDVIDNMILNNIQKIDSIEKTWKVCVISS